MTKFSHLPLIALVSLGLAACGDDIEPIEEEDEVTVVTPENGMGAEPDTLGESEFTEEGDAMMLEDDMTAMDGEGVLTVSVSGVQPNVGEVYIALQSEDDFAAAGGDYTKIVPAGSAVVEATFTGVEEGDWAVAAFQDTDGDGSLTLGETGPTEPWGFSGSVDRTQAPEWEEAMIDVEGDRTLAYVALGGGQM